MRRWIERQRHVLDFTLSSLLRRRAKNLGLVTLYSLVVFVLASVTFFTQALRREAGLLLSGAPELVIQRTVAGRHDLMPVSYIETVRRIRGVQKVQGRLWGYYFDQHSGANLTLLVPPGGSEPTTPGQPLPGIAGDPPAPGRIRIGAGVSRVTRTVVGDSLSFRGQDGTYRPFRIDGTFTSASELVSSDLVLMGEADFRNLFGIPGEYVTDLSVTVRNPSELSTIVRKIRRQLPDTRPITRDEMLRTYESVFEWRGGTVVVIFSAALLAFVIFAWDRASGLSAEERREIGILKAIGWETADVLLLKFWEGTVVSLSAFLGGVLLAYLHVFFFDAGILEPALKGWSTLYPKFRLVPSVGAEQIAVLFFLTVVPYTVATILPSWRAATIDPDAAMRLTEE